MTDVTAESLAELRAKKREAEDAGEHDVAREYNGLINEALANLRAERNAALAARDMDTYHAIKAILLADHQSSLAAHSKRRAADLERSAAERRRIDEEREAKANPVAINRDDAAAQITGTIVEALGASWNELSDSDREDIRQTAKYAAKLAAIEAKGRHEKVARNLQHVEAQIANWSFEASGMAERGFWTGVRRVLEVVKDTGAGVLAGAAKKFLGMA